MPLPVAGAVAITNVLAPNLFAARTPDSTHVARVKESLDAAYRARDARRLLAVANQERIDLPYPNSGDADGWPEIINFADNRPTEAARAEESAYARTLYVRLTGSANAMPSGGQMANVSRIAEHTDAQGDSLGASLQRALQSAIAAGRSTILSDANAQNSNNPADARMGGFSVTTLVLIAVAAFLLLRK